MVPSSAILWLGCSTGTFERLPCHQRNQSAVSMPRSVTTPCRRNRLREHDANVVNTIHAREPGNQRYRVATDAVST